MKNYRILENLDGTGKVLDETGQNYLSTVRYSIQVVQENTIVKSLAGSETIPGLKNIKGSITILDGERHLSAKGKLLLQLDDERNIYFGVRKEDFLSATCEIFNMSSQGFFQPS